MYLAFCLLYRFRYPLAIVAAATSAALTARHETLERRRVSPYPAILPAAAGAALPWGGHAE